MSSKAAPHTSSNPVEPIIGGMKQFFTPSIARVGCVALLLGCAPMESSQELGPDAWTEVPVRIVPELQVESNALVRDGFVREPCEANARFDGAALQLTVTNFNGLYGQTLELRLTQGPAGRWRAWSRGLDRSDVGATDLPIIDLVGTVEVQAREAADQAPLELSFDLVGIQLRFNYCEPVRLQGSFVVGVPRGLPAFEVTSDPQGEHASPVLLRWSSGMPRAFGAVDARGRRTGPWTTWYPDGARQTVSHFERGSRSGVWRNFATSGEPRDEGQLADGLRTGTWSEVTGPQGLGLVETGAYERGARTGVWTTTKRSDGSLRSRGEYEAHRKVGQWVEWWSNGNVRSEVQYNAKGHPEGPFKRWLSDGTLEAEGVNEPPPWGRIDRE